MAEIKTVNLEVNSNLEQTEQAVVSLKSELRKAQQEVATLSDKFGATSKEAIEAAKRAADLKDRIGDAKDLTDAFNPDAKFKALAGAANIAAGALAGFEGAMGLVGVQSEDAQQAILKVQSALALSQGLDVLQQIPDTFKNIKAVALNAFQGIKGAIGATGIGLLVVALGALYANWDALKKLVGDSIPALKEGTKQFDKLKEVFFGVGNAIVQYLLTPFKAVLKLLQLDFKGAIQEIKNGSDVIANYEKGASKERQQQNDAYAKARLEKQIKNKDNEIAIAKAYGKDTYDLEKDNLNRKLLLNKGNQEELEKLRQEERLLDASHKKSLQDKQKEYNEELKKKREEAREQDKKDLIEFNKSIEKGLIDLQIATNNATFEQRNLDIENKKNQVLQLAQLSEENSKNEEEAASKDIAIAQAVADQKKALQNAQLNAISAGIGLLSGLAGKNKALQKAAIIAESAMGIARSIIANTASNVAVAAQGAALAIPTGGASVAAAASIIATNNITTGIGIATNIVATAKALSSLGGGGAPSGGGQNMSSGGSAAGSVVPNFNVVGASATNQLAQTIGNKEQQPIKAYVVSNDVTTAQGLDRNIIQSATLGG
jgi:hypothetical protein